MRGMVAVEGDTGVVARSDVRLGFERPEQRDFRTQVQAACRGLSPRLGTVLRAVYAHPITREAVDLENVALYNVGLACVGHLARYGVVLEREPGLRLDDRFDADLHHELRYEVTPYSGWTCWRPSRLLYDVVLDNPAGLVVPTAKKVWVAGRRGQVTVQSISPEGPLLVDVEIGGGAALLGMMKPVVDGLLAVGHSYVGGEQEALAARREAIQADLEDGELERSLQAWDAPLGPWRFLFARGDGVQVSPADDRIVGLRMTRREQRGLRFSVHKAEPC